MTVDNCPACVINRLHTDKELEQYHPAKDVIMIEPDVVSHKFAPDNLTKKEQKIVKIVIQLSKDIRRHCQECDRPDMTYCYLLKKHSIDKYGDKITSIAVCLRCIRKKHKEFVCK